MDVPVGFTSLTCFWKTLESQQFIVPESHLTDFAMHHIVHSCCSAHNPTMRSLAPAIAVLLAVLTLCTAQDQTFVQRAQKQNLVDVQFFADAHYMMVHTPWAYYDFNPIQVGACTACTDFQVPAQWLSAGLLSPGRTAKCPAVWLHA